MRQFLIAATILLSIWSNEALAQSSNPKKAFKIACWSEWNKEPVYIETKKEGSTSKEMIAIETHTMSYSASYKYTATKPINLFQKSNDPENPYKLFKSISIPGSIKLPLVLLLKGKSGWKHQVYDIHPSVFPYGSYKIVNYTPQEIWTKMGSKKVRIAPNRSKSITLSSKYAGKSFHCMAAHNQKGKPQVVYSNMFKNRASKRLLLFFYTIKDAKGNRSVKTKSLVDFRQAVQT